MTTEVVIYSVLIEHVKNGVSTEVVRRAFTDPYEAGEFAGGLAKGMTIENSALSIQKKPVELKVQ
jgi:hypothetical protein